MAEDAVTLITKDHREMEQIFELLRTQPQRRGELVPKLAAMLIAHSRAEEEHVYPEIVKAAPEERGEVHHGKEEHEEAERILHRLEKADPDSKEFDKVLEELVDAVTHHVQEEESEILPTLADAVGKQRLRELGEAFSKRRAEELQSHGAGIDNASDGQTKDELYQQARELGVEGRSTMNKDELAKAVEKQTR